MNVTAYVLIQTSPGRAAEVARQLVHIQGVKSADTVTGSWDVIARAEAESVDELARKVVNHLQAIEGTTRTVTCPVLHWEP